MTVFSVSIIIIIIIIIMKQWELFSHLKSIS